MREESVTGASAAVQSISGEASRAALAAGALRIALAVERAVTGRGVALRRVAIARAAEARVVGRPLSGAARCDRGCQQTDPNAKRANLCRKSHVAAMFDPVRTLRAFK